MLLKDVSKWRRWAEAVWLAMLMVAGPVQSAPLQRFTDKDQAMVLDWLNDAGLVAYSVRSSAAATVGSSDHDRWFNTYQVLQALHSTRQEKFYGYLATQLAGGDGGISQWLRSILDLNRTQEEVLDTLIQQQNTAELAPWLQHYVALEAYLDKTLATQLLALLTQSTLSATEHCPEVATLMHFKDNRERRQAILRCLTRAIGQPILDIDISINRVTTIRLLNSQPGDLPLPPPAMLDNSENHFVMIPGFYHNAELQPIILLTTPTDSGFITAGTRAEHLLTMGRELGRRLPRVRLTKADREKIRQAYGVPAQSGQSTQAISSAYAWMRFWITSPGYSIAASTAVGLGITLFIAFYPFPGNPFLPPM